MSVALIGADGAGKTSLALALERAQELRVKYIYMGINAAASNHMLPTTRALEAWKRLRGRAGQDGGPPDPERERRRKQKRGLARLLAETKSTLLFANRSCEEWYRLTLAWLYQRRGYVVLFDRHFYADYWSHDVSAAGEKLPFLRRLHGKLLRRMPRPDCTILLDAPAEVLFARKREGTLELVARRRQEYLDLRPQLGACAVVDAAQPPEAVRAQVLSILRALVDGSRPAPGSKAGAA